MIRILLTAALLALAGGSIACAQGAQRPPSDGESSSSSSSSPSSWSRGAQPGFASHLVPVDRPFTMITQPVPRPLVQIPFDWQTRPVATLRGSLQPIPYEPSPGRPPPPVAPVTMPVQSTPESSVQVEPLPAPKQPELFPATPMPAVPPLGLTAAGSAATVPAPGPVAAIPARTVDDQAQPLDSPERWRVNGSDTLKSALEAWAERAGWKMYYLTSSQYPMAPAEFDGAFPAAVERVFSAMSARRPLPTVTIHPANRSVVVRSIAVEDDQ